MARYDRRTFLKASGGLGAVSLSGCVGGIGGGGGTPTIAFGWVVPVENIGSMLDIPEIQEKLPNEGDAYEFESVHHSSTPEGVSAMASGETQATLVTSVSYGNAIEQEAVPSGVQAVLTDFWDAYPDKFGFHIFSGPDTGIKEPADMEGKKLAVNATGTIIHAVYVKALTEVGLDPEKDVEFVEIGFPAFIEAIKEGKVDAGIFPALFALQAGAAGFNLVYTSHDFFEGYPAGYMIAPNSVLDDHGDAMAAFLEDYVFTLNWMRDNRSQAVSLAAEHFGLPEKGLDAMMLTKNDYYRGDLSMDIEALNRIMDILADLGFVPGGRDYGEFATNEYHPSPDGG